jgi:Carboxypeptidase regulatory-like domain/TonB-dependent Receptor Plug Domain
MSRTTAVAKDSKSYAAATSSQILLLLFLLHASVTGQTTTGQISGSAVDASGLVLVGATVTLRNEGTGDTRMATTSDAGHFIFPTLVPGSYAVKVELSGFKSTERTGIVLTANERRALGSIVLEVTTVAETVSVRAESVAVQTSSSENSELLSTRQIEQLGSKGRDIVALLRVMPGVSASTDNAALGDTFGTATPNIGGTRNRMNTFTLDGQTGSDADLVDRFNGATSMDAIAEVKVLVNNYQAEYGRNAGAFVNIVSKSGTREFHGSGYWFTRHENLNANDFFNNRRNAPKPLYRYDTLGGTIGGPVIIPRVFNSNRDKLFFFYSREDWRIQEPRNPRTVTVPTMLERQGNFSQSRINNQPVLVRDPMSGLPCTAANQSGCFPNQTIPASRVNANGLAILNLFPDPNFFDTATSGGNYNYVFQEITEHPKKQNMLKMDYTPTDNDRISFRGRTWWADRRGYEGLAAFNSNWDQLRHHYLFKEDSVMASYTRVFSPTIVNEFNVSYRVLGEIGDATSEDNFDRVIRGNVGLGSLGQLYPALNPLRIIPRANFGGVPNAANMTYDDRLPIDAGDERYIVLNNLSWAKGNHNLKFGFYYERNYASEGPRTNFGGEFSFDADPNNPLNTGNAFANAALGVFRTYTEGSDRTTARNVIDLFEWFAQDSWKMTPRLTVDYGMRFSRATPYRFPDQDAAAFVFEEYDPARAPLLYQSALNAAGQRVSRNPVTGELGAAVLIGAYVPGTGDVTNGMVMASDARYRNGFTDQQPIQLGPRLGFSWDVFGDGNTAVRGGFGVTKNMIPSSGLIAGAANNNPPNQFRPQIFYGTMDTFLSSTGVLFPNNVTSFDWDQKIPTVRTWSIGVQRDVGFSTLLDLAYVGNSARYLSQQRNLNLVPYGARFLPQNADPANPSTPLADNFFRPYPGIGNLDYREYSGISNYHGLQASLNRRFVQGIQFGLSYTWSKSMDYTSGDNGGIPTYQPVDEWVYGLAAFDQQHVAVVNFIWDLPKLASSVPMVVRAVLDNWQISGIGTFASGTPAGVALATTDNFDFSGGGDGTRVNVTGPVDYVKESGSLQWIAPDFVARPARGDDGNTGKFLFRNPGIHNWDVALFKNIPFGRARQVQFRWEAYNVFNHTQYATVDTTARFNPAGQQVNATFGQVTSTRPPRQMQVSLRVQF